MQHSNPMGHLCGDELRLQEFWITYCGQSASWMLRVCGCSSVGSVQSDEEIHVNSR